MLNFIAQRRLLFGAAALVFLFGAVAAWIAPSAAPWLAAALAGVLVTLAFVRMRTALREVFRCVAELKQENAGLRTRLALAERRLAALAIAIDRTDKLDESSV